MYKFIALFMITLIISVNAYAETGKNTTRASSKWLSVSQAFNEIYKKCGDANLGNYEIKTTFSHETGWVAEVTGDCGKTSTASVFLYWGYDFHPSQSDGTVQYRSDQWLKKVDLEVADKACSKIGLKRKNLEVLSENNSRKAGKDEYVKIYDGNLEYQWIAWMLTCG